MSAGRPPWWLWPNLLALDAPAVALVWQEFLALRHGVGVPLAARAALGLAVWGVYLLDRWLDARAGRRDTARHRFAAGHLTVFRGGAAFALFASAVSALMLSVEMLAAGSAVALGCALYVAAVAFARPGPTWKSATASLLFASGVAVGCCDSASLSLVWVADLTAFAAICCLNCLVISRGEDGSIAPSVPPLVISSWFAFAGLGAGGHTLILVVVPVVSFLLWLDRYGPTSPDRRRVLADAVLLLPAPLVGYVWARS